MSQIHHSRVICADLAIFIRWGHMVLQLALNINVTISPHHPFAPLLGMMGAGHKCHAPWPDIPIWEWSNIRTHALLSQLGLHLNTQLDTHTHLPLQCIPILWPSLILLEPTIDTLGFFSSLTVCVIPYQTISCKVLLILSMLWAQTDLVWYPFYLFVSAICEVPPGCQKLIRSLFLRKQALTEQDLRTIHISLPMHPSHDDRLWNPSWRSLSATYETSWVG